MPSVYLLPLVAVVQANPTPPIKMSNPVTLHVLHLLLTPNCPNQPPQKYPTATSIIHYPKPPS
jgi:hypothetical protein